MSIIKTLSALAAGVLLMATAACASTGQFDPATGSRVTTIDSGNCTPDQTLDGKRCICDTNSRGNYINCSFRLVAKAAPPRTSWSWTWSQCMGQNLDTFQACQAGSLRSVDPDRFFRGFPVYFNGQNYGGQSVNGQGYIPGTNCRVGEYCCPRPRYGETTHPLCAVMPQQPYRRP